MALITCRKSELMELRCSLPFVTAIEHGSRGTRRYSFIFKPADLNEQ